MNEKRLTDKTLLPVLTALATSVLAVGVSSAEFARVARQAFVQAATERCRFRNGKVNHSLVAAMTGLSRVEVRRILTGTSTDDEVSVLDDSQSVADKIVAGWRTDPLFGDKQGRPRVLTSRGGKRSFSSLSRKYCERASPTAALQELQRRGLVKMAGDRVHLRAPQAGSAALKRLKKLSPILIQLCLAAADNEGSAAKSRVEFAYLPVRDAVEATMVKKHAAATLSAATRSLQAITRSKARPQKPARLLVATVLAEMPFKRDVRLRMLSGRIEGATRRRG